MKKCILFLFVLSLVSISCGKTERDNLKKNNFSSGYVWINYVGTTDKIKKFILIRTCEKDTSYYMTYKEDWLDFSNNETFFEIYCLNFIVDSISFENIKTYIKSNKTDKQEIAANIDNYCAVKIRLVDRNDSLTYVINNEESDFFERMIHSINMNDNEKLISSLKYYHTILNSIGSQ